nr:hypothetical protein [Micromonospora sp. DSM 115978]
VATGSGGDLEAGTRRSDGGDRAPGSGLAGFVRTLTQEVPGLGVRLVDVDPKAAPTQVAKGLLAELFTPAGPAVVGHRDGIRSTPVVSPAPLPATVAATPAGLGPASVVLLTGGARGITAQVAIELARRTGCAVELVGRTPLPTGPEDAATAAATDAPSLRRALITSGIRKPAEIEARLSRLLAEREMRATVT